jgi:hypothetical protein
LRGCDDQARLLRAAEYDSELENAGMQVKGRRFRNRLLLAQILSIANKPPADGARATS